LKAIACCNVKGGVGKTIVALNIAHKLNKMGKKVALIDCDMDNSNFVAFTKSEGKMEVDKNHIFKPYQWNGIQVFSMSLVVGTTKSVSMSGDRYVQVLDDAVKQTKWDTEYFILDLPAGSSDVFRIAMHEFIDNLAGNIIVTQPSVIDATRRTLNLHKYLDIPILGLIENMSYFECTAHTKPKIYHIFGKSNVAELAKEFNTKVIGKIPLNPQIAEGIANGNPIFPNDIVAIKNACDTIINAKIKKTGFLEKIKKTITEKIKDEIEKVLVTMLVSAKKEFDVDSYRQQTGFTEKRPFFFVITDRTGTVELTRVALRVEESGFKVIENPDRVDFEIAVDFKTLARMIMGKKKVNGELVDFDPMDAWLMGDCRVYGEGFTPRAVKVFDNLFGSESIMNNVRQKYAKILGRWL